MLVLRHVIVVLILLFPTTLLALQLQVPPGGVRCIRESLPAGSTATFSTHAIVPLHLHARDWGRRIVASGTGANPSLNVTVPRYGVRRRRPVNLEYTFCMRARNEARVHFDIRVRGEAVFVLNKLLHAIDTRREMETRIFTAAEHTAALLVVASILSGLVTMLTAMAQFSTVQCIARYGPRRRKMFFS